MRYPLPAFIVALACSLTVLSVPINGYCGRGHSSEGVPYHTSGHGSQVRSPGHHRTRQESRAGVSPVELILKVRSLSRCPDPRSKKELAGYTARAMSPGFLRQASERDLAALALGSSRLIGTPYQGAGRDALLAVADMVASPPPRTLRSWPMKNLSMLVSALQRVQKEARAISALKVIAGEVGSRREECQLQTCWSLQSLLACGGAFSRLEGKRALLGLQAIADAVVARKTVMVDEQGGIIKPVVLLANAFSRAKGERIEAALRVIADTVVDQSCTLLDRNRWSAKDLAQLANALSKTGGRRVTGALKAIAKEIVSRRESLHDNPNWNAQHLSMVANGISKIAGDDDVSEVMEVLSKVVADRDQLADEQLWSAQDLAMFGNGICKEKGDSVRRVLMKMAGAVLSRPDLQDRRKWPARSLAMVANAICKEENDSAVNRALARFARVMVQREAEPHNRERWTLLGLAMMANAISKAGIDEPVSKALNLIARQVNHLGLGCESADRCPRSQLMMIANGLSKAGGDDIHKALQGVAREVIIQSPELDNDKPWSIPHLAGVAGSLGKVPLEQHVARALNLIAATVANQRERLADVSVQDLVVLANGFSKVEGRNVFRALFSMAEIVVDRETELQDPQIWPPQDMAMLANALSKYSGSVFYKALGTLAEAVVQRRAELVSNSEWSAKHLAMVVHGLSRVPGENVSKALTAAAEAIQQNWPEFSFADGWLADTLVKTASGMHLPACSQVFEGAVERLMAYAGTDPHQLAWLLSRMSGWYLPDSQLQKAARLFQALQEVDYTPANLHDRELLMWSATVKHRACLERIGKRSSSGDNGTQQQSDELARLAQLFADNYQRYNQQRQQWLNAATDTAAQEPEHVSGITYDKWHMPFVRDYWQESVSAPVISNPLKNIPGGSSWQSSVYMALKNRYFKGRSMCMEARVNQYPVDILLEGSICIEVDGPSHFISCDAGQTSSLHCRLPKDDLIDHMMERYGLSVVHIPYTTAIDSEEFKAIVRHIFSLLKGRDR